MWKTVTGMIVCVTQTELGTYCREAKLHVGKPKSKIIKGSRINGEISKLRIKTEGKNLQIVCQCLMWKYIYLLAEAAKNQLCKL